MANILSEGLRMMPSFDDFLDHTDDELLDTTTPQQKPMNFVPSHFDEESGSDEDTLSRDLTFPDITKESSRDLPNVDTPNVEDTVRASIAQAFVAQTFSSVMGSALQSLTNLAQSTSPPTRESDPREQVSYSTDTTDAVQMDLGRSPPNQRGAMRHRVSENSSDIDIDEEFEFLDDYDVEDEKIDGRGNS